MAVIFLNARNCSISFCIQFVMENHIFGRNIFLCFFYWFIAVRSFSQKSCSEKIWKIYGIKQMYQRLCHTRFPKNSQKFIMLTFLCNIRTSWFWYWYLRHGFAVFKSKGAGISMNKQWDRGCSWMKDGGGEGGQKCATP